MHYETTELGAERLMAKSSELSQSLLSVELSTCKPFSLSTALHVNAAEEYLQFCYGKY